MPSRFLGCLSLPSRAGRPTHLPTTTGASAHPSLAQSSRPLGKQQQHWSLLLARTQQCCTQVFLPPMNCTHVPRWVPFFLWFKLPLLQDGARDGSICIPQRPWLSPARVPPCLPEKSVRLDPPFWLCKVHPPGPAALPGSTARQEQEEPPSGCLHSARSRSLPGRQDPSGSLTPSG